MGFVDAFKSKTGDDTKPIIFSLEVHLSYRKHLIYLFTILILTTHSVSAEVKIGVVKLDILFKEIPIYKESKEDER